MTAQYTYWTLCIILLINTFNWLRKIYKSKCFLQYNNHNNNNNHNHKTDAKSPTSMPIAIIIPVLEETTRIQNTVEQMLSVIKDIPHSYIILATTEKEYQCHQRTNSKYAAAIKAAASKHEIARLLYDLSLSDSLEEADIEEAPLEKLKHTALQLLLDRATTIDAAQRLACSNSNVKVYHYDKTDGVMAHQVNAAIKAFVKELPSLKNTVLFGLYNADSYITKSTIQWVQSKRAEATGKSVIFQQYGNYIKNHSVIRSCKYIPKSILLVSSMWQTRWSIGFEIANALRQFKKNRLEYQFCKVKHQMLNYCIGHGLYFDYKTFQDFRGFSEITHNEDAIWGLQASYLKVPIIPVPILELSESPDTIRSLYKQKTTWYFGPMQAFKYYGIIKNMYKLKGFKQCVSLFKLSLSLFEHSIRWIAVPIQMLLMLALSGGSITKLLIAFSISTAYINIPNLIALKTANSCSANNNTVRSSFWDFIGMLVFAPLQFWLHGLSGLRAISKVTVSKITNNKLEKERTPLKGMN